MTSVIYVLSDSEEEEGPPDAKRARREQTKMLTSKGLPSKLLHIPKASITQLPPSAVGIKTSSIGLATPAGAGNIGTIVGTYKSMHIPSGITVTKHNNIISTNNNSNGNPKLSLEQNNNNNSSSNNNNNNNSLKSKPLKLTTANATIQNCSVWSKTPTTTLTLTSVPSSHGPMMSKGRQTLVVQTQQKALPQQQQTQPQLKLMVQPKAPTSTLTPQKSMLLVQQQKLTLQQQTKLGSPMQPSMPQMQQQQKPVIQVTQQKPQLQQQQRTATAMPTTTTTPAPIQLSITQKLPIKQKPQMAQRLPTVQKQSQPITPTPQKTVHLHSVVSAQKQPPPAHSGTTKQKQQPQQQQQGTLAPPPPAHHAISGAALSPPMLTKLTPMSMLIKQPPVMPSLSNSAARTLPYKTRPATTTVTATTTVSAITTATTTILRNVQQVATTPIQSMTAGATPPLRLLATPPHSAAALNEPLLLNLPPTTSITPQLTPTTTPPPPAVAAKILFPAASISPVNKPIAKRVQPITVLKKSDEEWRKHLAQQQQQKPKEQPSVPPTIVLVESPPTTPPTDKGDNEQAKRKTAPAADKAAAPIATAAPARSPLVTEYASLLQLCRELDKSKDMERLIEIKLLKYYYSVHENFVRSRGFRKQVEQAIERIRGEPDMIYVHLKCVVDELKVRRKAKVVELLPELEQEIAQQKPSEQKTSTSTKASTTAKTSPESKSVEDAPAKTPTTGNKRTDERIRKLNRTLYTITKRITALEEADVDWNDDDDSSYLQVERYKKRACQIYEKICDLTGESKGAHRQMKQPILFKDTPYPQFNRTLSAFVNRMHEFPDYHDVLQLLEHCNKEKDLGLATFEMKRIAHDAFVKVGRLLQARRKTDLYETVTHFTANAKDPAVTDAALLAKLNENNKKQTKISDILEKFAREQDLTTEEQREARQKEKLAAAASAAMVVEKTLGDSTKVGEDDEKPCTSAQAAQAAQTAQTVQTAEVLTNGLIKNGESDNESDSDDSGEDDDSDEDVDAFVDNFKANGDLSDADAESETEANSAPKTLATATHVIVNNVTRVKTAAPNETIQIDDGDKALTMPLSMPNGKLKDAPAAHMLKVMSVSSLNASVYTNSSTSNNTTTSSNSNKNSNTSNQQQQQQHKKKQKKQQNVVLDTEIVISDEES